VLTGRNFIKSAIALLIGGAIANYQTLSAPAGGLVKITGLKVMAIRGGGRGGRGGAATRMRLTPAHLASAVMVAP